MQQGQVFQKQQWVGHIENILNSGQTFQYRTLAANKSQLLFAADVFRRLNYNVSLAIDPTEFGRASLLITIQPQKKFYEFTMKRDDNPVDIIRKINQPYVHIVSIRGCGTVIDSLFVIIDYALHNGWIIDKTFMSTLTQTLDNNSKQRNTTLQVVLCRGSKVGTI